MASAQNSIWPKVLFALIALLTVSAVYLYGFPQQNVTYAVIVLLHVMGGIAAPILVLPLFKRLVHDGTRVSWAGWILFLAGAGLGIWLIHSGTPRSEWNWLYAHIIVCVAALGFLVAERMGRRGLFGTGA